MPTAENALNLTSLWTEVKTAARQALPIVDAIAAVNPTAKKVSQIAHILFDSAPASTPAPTAAAITLPAIGGVWGALLEKFGEILLAKLLARNGGNATVA